MTGIVLAALLSTGVDIPDDGVPTWESGMQYTTRTEKRPPSIPDEAAYLKWKWRMNLADPKTGFDNDALREGVRRIVEESGWKELERGQAPNVQINWKGDRPRTCRSKKPLMSAFRGVIAWPKGQSRCHCLDYARPVWL